MFVFALASEHQSQFDETYTVGTYSPGKLSVVYEMSMQVLPTVPSPTTTHLMGLPEAICGRKERNITTDVG